MKTKAYFIVILYLFLSVSGSRLYGVGEKTFRLGGDSSWNLANRRTGITEVTFIRPAPVLVLSSSTSGSAFANGGALVPDLSVSFDEGRPSLFRDSVGRYRVTVSPSIEAVDRRYARAGFGAASFPAANYFDGGMVRADGPLVIEAQSGDALFAPKKRIGDFTLEFWLHPMNLENGEQIFLWTSSLWTSSLPPRESGLQRILCVSSKNRLQWSFLNFFTAPSAYSGNGANSGANSVNLEFTGGSAVVPKTWSHHLIRFDSITGMIEYLVNGKTEVIVYATTTGREGGEVYTPLAGDRGTFVLGGGFTGLMDEFKIHGNYIPNPALSKYSAPGGRMETGAIDLGAGSNGVLKIEASGGKTSARGVSSEYRRNGRFLFSDSAEMQFFIRASENPYRWDSSWLPVTPGADISGSVSGRYVQIAVDFYPSANGEASPYLETLSVTYLPDEPPLPPAQLTAVAMDGSVHLQWRNSPDQNAQGYLVYYGTSSDDYFGEDALLGPSPIDAGKHNKINIEGLKNGVLYYFRVAAYSNNDSSLHTGEFSREVRARPLQGLDGL